MSETQNPTPVETTTVTPPAATVITPENLMQRAERIAREIADLEVHDAILVFNFVTEHLAQDVSREKAIVKTKFEEAMMWLNRHTVGLIVKHVQTAQADEAASASAQSAAEPVADDAKPEDAPSDHPSVV